MPKVIYCISFSMPVVSGIQDAICYCQWHRTMIFFSFWNGYQIKCGTTSHLMLVFVFKFLIIYLLLKCNETLKKIHLNWFYHWHTFFMISFGKHLFFKCLIEFFSLPCTSKLVFKNDVQSAICLYAKHFHLFSFKFAIQWLELVGVRP